MEGLALGERFVPENTMEMIARLITTSFLLFFIQIQPWCQGSATLGDICRSYCRNEESKYPSVYSGFGTSFINQDRASDAARSMIYRDVYRKTGLSIDDYKLNVVCDRLTMSSAGAYQRCVSAVIVEIAEKRTNNSFGNTEQTPRSEHSSGKPQRGTDASEIALSMQRNLERDVRAFVYADDGVTCSGEQIKHASLEDLVTSYFGTDLRILERRNLEVILNEQKSGMQGIFDESTIVEAGKLAGAQYVLIPKVSCFLGEETYNLKIISCLDATTMASANASAEDVKLRDFLGYVESQLYP